jgi:hypothetical protein
MNSLDFVNVKMNCTTDIKAIAGKFFKFISQNSILFIYFFIIVEKLIRIQKIILIVFCFTENLKMILLFP